MPTVAEWVSHAAEELARAGLPDFRRDAVEIVAAALGRPGDLGAELDAPVDEVAGSGILDRVARRRAGQPLAYVTGIHRFRGLAIVVDERVQVPKSDVVVDFGAGLPPGWRVHDVGTGSGAIALAIKHERPDLIVTGSDVSVDAVEVARANAAALQIDVRFDVADGVPPGDFDVVVGVMPYLLEHDPLAVGDYRYEPRVAIVVQGQDPTAILGHVVASAQPGQLVALQHARAHVETVREFFYEPFTFRMRTEGPWVTMGRAKGR